jgi:hypothetical protein
MASDDDFEKLLLEKNLGNVKYHACSGYLLLACLNRIFHPDLHR